MGRKMPQINILLLIQVTKRGFFPVICVIGSIFRADQYGIFLKMKRRVVIKAYAACKIVSGQASRAFWIKAVCKTDSDGCAPNSLMVF